MCLSCYLIHTLLSYLNPDFLTIVSLIHLIKWKRIGIRTLLKLVRACAFIQVYFKEIKFKFLNNSNRIVEGI
jgi:hypothetical protein